MRQVCTSVALALAMLLAGAASSDARGKKLPPLPLNPGDFRKGPWLVFPNGRTEMTVLWQTVSSPRKSYVEWGASTRYGSKSADLRESGGGEYDHLFTHTITEDRSRTSRCLLARRSS